MRNKQNWIAGGILLLFLLSGLYRCPIKELTGIPCPGCGMMHALTSLMHFNWHQSFYYHLMLIPTGILALAYLFVKNPQYKKGILVLWCCLMVGYYIYRMICYFPMAPMAYQEVNILHTIWNLLAS